MRQDRRGSWYLLTGVVFGIAIGLFYSWVISPVEYVDAPPYALRADFKDEYRALVAAAYLYSNDLLRAENRLAQLKDDDTAQSLAMQAQRALADGHPEAEVRALGFLAMALGKGVTPQGLISTQATIGVTQTGASTPTSTLAMPGTNNISTPEPGSTQYATAGTPEPTTPARPTNTTTSTATATATQGAPFILQETRLVCNPDQPQPLIQVEIKDAAGQPVPSVEVIATWEGGEDHFFTGLKPELGLGYADFTMTPGVVYLIKLAEGGQEVGDLTPAECLMEDESQFWGSWLLTFVQP